MKVEKLKNNITNSTAANNAQIIQRAPRIRLSEMPKDQVGFSGKVSTKEITEAVNTTMPAFIRGMKKAGSNMGEVQNIIINSLGTGLIAPIFIKWNPLSKTDEDTRTYSAWRQPVSAVLAVVTQAGVTIPFNQAINNMSNSGKFSKEKYNKTLFKDEDYVKKLIKSTTPNLSKEELASKVDEYMKNQDKSLLESLRNQNTIKYEYYNNNKPVAMKEGDYKQLLSETLDDIIKEEKAERLKCDNGKLKMRIQRSEYFRNNADKSKKLMDEVTTRLNSSNDLKDIRKFLNGKIKELKRDKADQELINILNEIRDRSAGGGESKFTAVKNWFKQLFGKKVDVKERLGNDAVMIDEMKAKAKKVSEHINKYSKLKSKDAVETAVKESLQSRIKELDGSLSFLEKVKGYITSDKKPSVSQIEEMFTKEIKKVKEHRLGDIVFGEKIIDKLKNKTKDALKGYKAIAGLIVSFAMLPITCSLLNWIYPRFMDAVFPNLSNKKHSNVSHDLVEKANKNSEVKS